MRNENANPITISVSAPYCGEYQKNYAGAPNVGAEVDVDDYADCAELCSLSADCFNWYLKVTADSKKCQLRGQKAAGETAVAVAEADTWWVGQG